MNEPSKPDSTVLEADSFRASDANKIAGFSYRQLNDWDAKGALPGSRELKEGWRFFSSNELLVMMICKEIRDHFGVPLQSLDFIKSRMLNKKIDYLRYALEMNRRFGFACYLLTDLKETFMIGPDCHIEDHFAMGFFRHNRTENLILINLNPLINKLLIAKDCPPLVITKSYETIRLDDLPAKARNSAENRVLCMIRNRDYSQVTVHLKSGRIVRADCEEEMTRSGEIKSDKEILDAVKNEKFQTVTIKTHEGKVIRMTRHIPKKLDTAAENS